MEDDCMPDMIGDVLHVPKIGELLVHQVVVELRESMDQVEQVESMVMELTVYQELLEQVESMELME